jgi:hypothetical protein
MPEAEKNVYGLDAQGVAIIERLHLEASGGDGHDTPLFMDDNGRALWAEAQAAAYARIMIELRIRDGVEETTFAETSPYPGMFGGPGAGKSAVIEDPFRVDPTLPAVSGAVPALAPVDGDSVAFDRDPRVVSWPYFAWAGKVGQFKDDVEPVHPFTAHGRVPGGGRF